MAETAEGGALPPRGTWLRVGGRRGAARRLRRLGWWRGREDAQGRELTRRGQGHRSHPGKEWRLWAPSKVQAKVRSAPPPSSPCVSPVKWLFVQERARHTLSLPMVPTQCGGLF